jgi:hypothetical protein
MKLIRSFLGTIDSTLTAVASMFTGRAFMTPAQRVAVYGLLAALLGLALSVFMGGCTSRLTAARGAKPVIAHPPPTAEAIISHKIDKPVAARTSDTLEAVSDISLVGGGAAAAAGVVTGSPALTRAGLAAAAAGAGGRATGALSSQLDSHPLVTGCLGVAVAVALLYMAFRSHPRAGYPSPLARVRGWFKTTRATRSRRTARKRK